MRRFATLLMLFLLMASPAYAWSFVQDGTRVQIRQESGDATSGVSAVVYSEYKGGDTWDGDWFAGYQSSYGHSEAYAGLLAGYGAAIDLPLDVSRGRCQMVELSFGGGGNAISYAMLVEPVAVSMPTTVAVSWMPPVVVSSMPSATIRVDASGTPLPVSVRSAANTDSLVVVTAWLVSFAVYAGLGFKAVGA